MTDEGGRRREEEGERRKKRGNRGNGEGRRRDERRRDEGRGMKEVSFIFIEFSVYCKNSMAKALSC